MSTSIAKKYVLELQTHLNLRMFSSKYDVHNRQLVLQQLQVQFQLRIIGTKQRFLVCALVTSIMFSEIIKSLYYYS
jgi:hypothetical protein